MIIRLDWHEQYPVYDIAQNDGVSVCVSEEQLKHWLRVQIEWKSMQNEMGILVKCNNTPKGEQQP
jgi:hypothetical protein